MGLTQRHRDDYGESNNVRYTKYLIIFGLGALILHAIALIIMFYLTVSASLVG